MAARTRFALVFWAAVAVVVTILTIKPWTSAPEAQGKSATPIAAREITGTCTEASASDPRSDAGEARGAAVLCCVRIRDCSAPYFPSLFAAFRMGDQRAISPFTKLANFAGVRSSLLGSDPPSPASRAWTPGSSSA